MTQPDSTALATAAVATPGAPWLAPAIAAAQAAAQIIRQAALDMSAVEVRAKRPNDYVTAVDLASEQLIVRTLLAAGPDHAVRSEEQAALHGNPSADHIWIVDPLDGTHNFIHGYPAYAVSIALAVRGRVEVGVVLDVPRDELFLAVRGGGAWQGFADGTRRRLVVSRRVELAEALIGSSGPLPPGAAFASAWQARGEVQRRAGALRRCGSAALELAWVAAGRSDGCFDSGLAPWDVAAGGLLVQEAGGLVTAFDGRADFAAIRECLAAPGPIHAALRSILTAPWPPSA